jgi:outer membrane receptor protein involved in Fe transport
VKLESISSYFYRNGNSVFDGTFFESFAWAGVPYPFIPGQQAPQFNAQSQNILTQEFRFSSTTENSRVSWVAGLFYSGARQADQTLVADPQFGTLIMDVFGLSLEDFFGTGLTDGKYTLVSNDSSKEEQAAVYAHADIKLTDTLDLGLGVRYANTRVKYFEQDGGTVYGTTHSYGGSQTHNPVTPQFSLKYQFQPNKMAYATVAEGYRLGGVNSPIPINPPCTAQLETLGLGSVPPTYNPDTLWNYEVGSKLRFLDNRVSVDFSAFHDVWNHIQQFVALPACGFLGFTGNLGKATSDGFDLDMAVHAGGGFQVELGVGYTHATYSETVGVAPAVVVSKGDTLPGTSPWIVSLTPEYRFTAFGEKQFYLRAQDQFHSHNNGSFPGMNPDSISYDPDIPLPPSRNLLNLRAGMIWSGVDASLFVNNVLNSHPGLQLSHPVAGDPLFSNLTFRPLTVGATLIYRY